MIKTVLKTALAAVLFGILTGCSASLLTSGKTWRLVSIRENQTSAAVPEEAVITLSVDDSNISGFSGVNVYNGPMAVEKGKLKLGPFATTMMMSHNGELSRVEREYFRLLDQTADAKEENGKLILMDSKKNQLLVFTLFTLEGTSWDLTGYNSGSAVVSTDTEHGQNAGIVFSPDNHISGSTGFNNFMGSYSIKQDSSDIKIKPAGMTKMASPSADAAKFEQLYISLLSDAAKYGISGDRLTLRDSGGTTLLTFTLKQN